MENWLMNSFSMFGRLNASGLDRDNGLPVWIKIRVDPTLEEHIAIDRYLKELAPADGDFGFEKHESGPEILGYLAAATAGLTLAKSVLDLITTIVKARSETQKKGVLPSKPIELIVRCMDEGNCHSDEVILRIGEHEAADETVIEHKLMDALRNITKRN